ncbi:peptidase M14, partial [Planctomycetota bacterium]
ADMQVFDSIARRGAVMLPGYRYLEVGNGLYEVFGGEFDWLYRMQGVITFTNELFTSFNLFRKSSRGRSGQEELHAFDRLLLFGEGMIEWKEVDHPQHGKVEVGGITKQWLRQPPSFLLEEECHRNMAFTLYHADQMPRIEVESITVRPLSDALCEVTAVIANQKLTPTRLAHDRKKKITAPDRVTLSGDGIRVIVGLLASDRLFQKAKEQKHEPESLRMEAVPGMGVVFTRWIVEGKGPFTVTARSTKGGVHTLRQ